MFKVTSLFVLCLQISALWSWSYEDTNSWKTQFPLCNGSLQSPIALNSKTAVQQFFPKVLFKNYFKLIPGKLVSLTNTNKTASLSLKKVPLKQRPMVVAKGGLFILDEIHFHWPSEHVIDNAKASLEVHLAHRNFKYNSVYEAAEKPNGVIVVAHLYSISYKLESSLLSPITKDLLNINDPGCVTSLSKDIQFGNIFPLKKQFFRYSGSLTTPKCNEHVNWIVYSNFEYVSTEDMQRFHQLELNNHRNDREIQELNGRKVILYS
ncbi:hypothetical protein ACFFRR_008366 [Megaselia abdita]